MNLVRIEMWPHAASVEGGAVILVRWRLDSEEDRQPASGSACRARLTRRFCHPLRRRSHALAGMDASGPVFRWHRAIPTVVGAASTHPYHHPGASSWHHGQPCRYCALVRVENRGAPLGPHAGQAELIQAADLCALLLQIYVVMGAGWVWHRGLQGEPVPAVGSAMVLLGAIGIVTLASTVGAASGLRHGHHAPAGAEAGAHHHGSGAEQTDDHHSHPEPSPAAPAGSPPPMITQPVQNTSTTITITIRSRRLPRLRCAQSKLLRLALTLAARLSRLRPCPSASRFQRRRR